MLFVHRAFPRKGVETSVGFSGAFLRLFECCDHFGRDLRKLSSNATLEGIRKDFQCCGRGKVFHGSCQMSSTWFNDEISFFYQFSEIYRILNVCCHRIGYWMPFLSTLAVVEIGPQGLVNQRGMVRPASVRHEC